MTNEADYTDESLAIVPDEDITSSQSPLPQLFDPEQQVVAIEKAVKFGPRLIAARNTLIRMFTYSEDWTRFGDADKAKACLSAAGAMRIADKGNFPIRFFNVVSRKESIKDMDMTVVGYRYVFEGYAQLNARVVHAVGQYSTRDALLGKKGGDFKDPMEINESYIRQAAHTYFKGNAIKDLLGLKGIPWNEFCSLTAAAGQKTEAAATVTHAKGTQGGIDDADRAGQNGLLLLLRQLADSGRFIAVEIENGKAVQRVDSISDELADYASNQKDPTATVAQASLRSLTTFVGRDKKVIQGITDFTRLKAKQLEIAAKSAQKLINEAPSSVLDDTDELPFA